jgi:DNA polymerase I-like protein with 3'-5' exonuclease and polymerase domains
MKVAFDIETDGLNPSRIHCIAAHVIGQNVSEFWTPDRVKYFPAWLVEINAEVLIGHNIIGFDLPVLGKLLGFEWWGGVEDTLVMSRLDNPSREGGHSLAAWGTRMNFPKGEYDDWSMYTEEMGEYCKQDVKVLVKLHRYMTSKKMSKAALDMEHKIAQITHKQTENGWKFDLRKATHLLAAIKEEMFIAEDEVRKVFKPLPVWVELNHPKDKCLNKDGSVSKRYQAQLDKGAHFEGCNLHSCKGKCKWGYYEYPEFNLGSRQQIARYLQHFGWIPKDFTELGTPIVSETILEAIEIPEGKLIAKYLMLQKRLGLVSAWIDAVDGADRIHGKVNTCGAVTGRMTHSSPNLAQVPASHSPYGEDCRELFTVEEGYKLVGMDASGLELRMLAHYMNDEDYTNEVINGDIHTANQRAANIESRDKAKTFIYAFLYGAGDGKIGQVIGGTAKDGKRLKADFLKNTPALKKLRTRVTSLADSGSLIGLDGRVLHIRSQHAALNTLLQSAGAIVMKRAVVLLDHFSQVYKIDYKIVGQIHDEVQVEVEESKAQFFGDLAVNCIRRAGKDFKLNCPLDGDYKIGTTWRETH